MPSKAVKIKKVAEMMRDLDFCMLTTNVEGGMRSRPMSNNGEVEFDGDVWFFTAADSRKVQEVEADPRVQLNYSDLERFLFVSMTGEASIVTDVEKKKELWVEDIEEWFEQGPEDEGVVLLKVTPTRVEYWSGEGQDEIELT